jgi:cytoskeletal protein CcmA (bactofilin family)
MGIKENFTQAVKELTGAGKDNDKKSTQVEDLKRALDAESSASGSDVPEAVQQTIETAPEPVTEAATAEIPVIPAPVVVPEPAASVSGSPAPPLFAPKATHSGLDVNIQELHQTPNASDLMFSSSYNSGSEPSPVSSPFGQSAFPRAEPSPIAASPFTTDAMAQALGEASSPDAPEELTHISKSTVIEGNMRSFGNINVEGNIRGDIETTKNIDLNGKVIGNLTCNNAQMLTSQIQGNVRMKGNILMGRDTLLIGDLVSTYAKVNGKVKGNLEIGGKAELKSDAVIFGDISASTITVDDGAIIQGYVSTTFLNKEESRNIFPDAISIAE